MNRRTAASALLVPVLLLPLAACGEATSTVAPGGGRSAPPPASTPPAAPSAAPVQLGQGGAPDPAVAAADESFEISYADDKAAGDTGRLKIALGDSVAITVTSLTADEVHLHGYDLSAPVRVGLPAVITFDAKIPGVFALELEGRGVQLATLQVQ